MHEASSAIDRGVYAPVRIELCNIEEPYSRIQATDILRWDGLRAEDARQTLHQATHGIIRVARFKAPLVRDLGRSDGCDGVARGLGELRKDGLGDVGEEVTQCFGGPGG